MKICSQSLFFDPQDESLPGRSSVHVHLSSYAAVIRYEFKHLSIIEPWSSSTSYVTVSFFFPSHLFTAQVRVEPQTFVIKGTHSTHMRSGHTIEPYRFIKKDFMHQYSLHYCQMSDFIARLDRLYKISKLDRYDAQEAVKLLIREREATTVFDTTWLEHLGLLSLAIHVDSDS